MDIDADGDYDMFIGSSGSAPFHFYRNDGTVHYPQWRFITDHYNNMNSIGRLSPEFVDIDADGDYDLFIGEYHGSLNFYLNIGCAKKPQWKFITNHYYIDIGERSIPTLVDIDNDGDLDLFIGSFWINRLIFVRNDGTPEQPQWTFVTDRYAGIELIRYDLAPIFIDIDADGDYDLFGGSVGYLYFYRNDGKPEEPIWTFITDDYTADCIDQIYLGGSLKPAFVDIDADSDYDLFIGNTYDGLIKGGRLHFIRNDGSPYSPNWTYVTSFYGSIDVGDVCAPAFYDEDQDGDHDLFIGDNSGKIYFYRNAGSPRQACWQLVTEYYNGINVGWVPIPFFADIDNDGDKDLFIGEQGGGINLYRNEIISSVKETASTSMPTRIALNQNYPNPFNAQTVISYQINRPSSVCLKIFNLFGKEVKILVSKNQQVGQYRVNWDGEDNRGNQVASGIYFCILEMGGLKATRQLVLLK